MPKQVTLSDAVWDEIAKQGNFGESEDDVLRRILGLPEPTPDEIIQMVPRSRPTGFSSRKRYALTDKGHEFLKEYTKPTQKRAILELIQSLTKKRKDGAPEQLLLRAMRDHPVLMESKQPMRKLLSWYQSSEFGPEHLTIVADT